MKNGKTTADQAKDHERLLAEAVALGQRGNVSQADLGALEARLQKAMKEDEQRLAASLAEIQQKYAMVPRPPASRGWELFTGAMFFIPLAGLFFGISLAPGVFSSLASRYEFAMYWAFFGALALWMGVFLRSEVRERMRIKHPNWVWRWLLVFPLSIASMAALSVAAIPGWAAFIAACAALVR
ncbi:hypothetical protein DBR42_16760 [Pelomonas sp. HMWF004]|nr:hypothetical protein DBR42_16760 [Pelomonas sp. HMWF004]